MNGSCADRTKPVFAAASGSGFGSGWRRWKDFSMMSATGLELLCARNTRGAGTRECSASWSLWKETGSETLMTMKQGAQVIALSSRGRAGRVDVLRCVNVSSAIGGWSYEGTHRCRRPPGTPDLSAIPSKRRTLVSVTALITTLIPDKKPLLAPALARHDRRHVFATITPNSKLERILPTDGRHLAKNSPWKEKEK